MRDLAVSAMQWVLSTMELPKMCISSIRSFIFFCFVFFSDLCLHSQQALGLKLKRVGWLYGGGLRTLAGTSLGAGYADGNALNAQFSATGVPGVVIRPSISAWVISDSV